MLLSGYSLGLFCEINVRSFSASIESRLDCACKRGPEVPHWASVASREAQGSVFNGVASARVGHGSAKQPTSFLVSHEG